MGKYYYKIMLTVYFLGLTLCGIARVLLKMRFIDPVTGFYTANNGIVVVFSVSLMLSVVVLFVLNRLRRTTNDFPISYNSRISGLLCALSGAAIILYAVTGSPYPPLEQNFSETTIQLREIFAVVLGVLAGGSLLWLGVNGILDRPNRAAILPALFPSIWQAFMLVTRFNGFTVLTTMTDNLLTVLFMIFSTLFFIGHSRTIYGFTRKDGRNYTIPAGLATSLTGLVLVIPNYLYMIVNKAGMPAPLLEMTESIYILIASVYSLVFVFGMVRSIKQV